MNSKHSGGSDPSAGSERGQPGDVSHDPKRTSDESKKRMQPGYPDSRNPQRDSEKSHQGGNFVNDPAKAGEAGHKGGQHSHGGPQK